MRKRNANLAVRNRFSYSVRRAHFIGLATLCRNSPALATEAKETRDSPPETARLTRNFLTFSMPAATPLYVGSPPLRIFRSIWNVFKLNLALMTTNTLAVEIYDE